MKKKLIEDLKKYQTSYEDERRMVEQTIMYLEENEVFLGKSNTVGHITGSAWILNSKRNKALLTHHFKLDMWVQLGGHTEEEETVYESACREGIEESGLRALSPVHTEIFDVDVHLIPERKSQPAHYHYDIRYVFEADDQEKIAVSNESHDVCWVSLEQINDYTNARSVLRMVEKTEKLF